MLSLPAGKQFQYSIRLPVVNTPPEEFTAALQYFPGFGIFCEKWANL